MDKWIKRGHLRSSLVVRTHAFTQIREIRSHQAMQRHPHKKEWLFKRHWSKNFFHLCFVDMTGEQTLYVLDMFQCFLVYSLWNP